MCIRTNDQSVFFVDHMARGLLLGAHLYAISDVVELTKLIDLSLFKLVLTHDKLESYNVYMRALVDNLSDSPNPRKRA